MTTPAVTPTTPAIPPPPSGTIVDSNPNAAPIIPPPPSGTIVNNPPTAEQTGEIVNDVGQKVIVPKEGESFAETLKRAVAYHKSLTPEQQKAALDAETATIPAKTAQTLAVAPAIGFAQPATIAGATELPTAANAAKNAVLKQLAEQSPDLFGHEAVKATLKRYALQGLQKAAEGGAWGLGVGTVGAIGHAIWEDVYGKK